MFGHPRTALLLYAVAMGYLEAAVVVYLRAIYYPEGFSFPLKPMDPGLLGVEMGSPYYEPLQGGRKLQTVEVGVSQRRRRARSILLRPPLVDQLPRARHRSRPGSPTDDRMGPAM